MFVLSTHIISTFLLTLKDLRLFAQTVDLTETLKFVDENFAYDPVNSKFCDELHVNYNDNDVNDTIVNNCGDDDDDDDHVNFDDYDSDDDGDYDYCDIVMIIVVFTSTLCYYDKCSWDSDFTSDACIS